MIYEKISTKKKKRRQDEKNYSGSIKGCWRFWSNRKHSESKRR
jgi:hypothetical protein